MAPGGRERERRESKERDRAEPLLHLFTASTHLNKACCLRIFPELSENLVGISDRLAAGLLYSSTSQNLVQQAQRLRLSLRVFPTIVIKGPVRNQRCIYISVKYNV